MIVGKSIKTLLKHPKLCLPFSIPIFLLIGIPLSILFLFSPSPEDLSESVPTFFIFLFLLSVLFYLMMNEICILMVYDLEQNGKISCSSAFKKCFSHLRTVLVSSLLLEIIVSAGMLVLLIPGIYLMCRLSMTEQAVAIEGKGAIESIKRSWNITRGRALEIFSILLVTILSLFLFFILLFFISSFFYIPIVRTVASPLLAAFGIGSMFLLIITPALIVIATTYHYLELITQERGIIGI